MLTIVMWSGPVLEAAVLVGLVVRRRVGAAFTLPVLLLVLMLSDSIVGVCPPCNTWDFWLVKEFVHAGLFLLLGLELSERCFRAHPLALRAARRWTAFVLLAAAVLIVAAPDRLLIVGVLPRLMGTLAWLYFGLAIVALRYTVVLDPLRDTVLNGLAPYLILYAATWSQAAASTAVADVVNPLMFVMVLLALLRAAWSSTAPPRLPWPLRLWRRLRPRPPARGTGQRGHHSVAPDVPWGSPA